MQRDRGDPAAAPRRSFQTCLATREARSLAYLNIETSKEFLVRLQKYLSDAEGVTRAQADSRKIKSRRKKKREGKKMLIGICGSKYLLNIPFDSPPPPLKLEGLRNTVTGICSGKSTVAQYLVEHHGFTHVFVTPKQTPNGVAPRPPENTHHAHTRPSLSFSTSDELLEHVTRHWRDRWVTTDVLSKDVLDNYSRRPFFLLISVDAPLLVRWQRYQQRHAHNAEATLSSLRITNGADETADGDTTTTTTPFSSSPAGPSSSSATTTTSVATLEAFAALSDAQLYHPLTGQATHISSAPVRLLNTSRSLASLYANLGKLDLLSAERLRPSWDHYFMALASLAARRSNCMKRRVGCVVVSRTSRRVVSTGYNGTPRGLRNCADGGCGRCNAGLGAGAALATCLCIHAEENALLEAGRDHLREGAVLYCDTCPCLTCSIKIAQVGVSEVVYAQGFHMDKETAAVFKEAGVVLRQFIPVSSFAAPLPPPPWRRLVLLLAPLGSIGALRSPGVTIPRPAVVSEPSTDLPEHSLPMASSIWRRWRFSPESGRAGPLIRAELVLVGCQSDSHGDPRPSPGLQIRLQPAQVRHIPSTNRGRLDNEALSTVAEREIVA